MLSNLRVWIFCCIQIRIPSKLFKYFFFRIYEELYPVNIYVVCASSTHIILSFEYRPVFVKTFTYLYFSPLVLPNGIFRMLRETQKISCKSNVNGIFPLAFLEKLWSVQTQQYRFWSIEIFHTLPTIFLSAYPLFFLIIFTMVELIYFVVTDLTLHWVKILTNDK